MADFTFPNSRIISNMSGFKSGDVFTTPEMIEPRKIRTLNPILTHKTTDELEFLFAAVDLRNTYLKENQSLNISKGAFVTNVFYYFRNKRNNILYFEDTSTKPTNAITNAIISRKRYDPLNLMEPSISHITEFDDLLDFYNNILSDKHTRWMMDSDSNAVLIFFTREDFKNIDVKLKIRYALYRLEYLQSERERLLAEIAAIDAEIPVIQDNLTELRNREAVYIEELDTDF